MANRFLVTFAFAALCACGGETPAAPTTNASGSEAAASAPESAWKVNYDESRLGFSATQSGGAFTGEFEKFDAVILFDPENLAAASIDATVDMSSAKTGDRQRDTALPGNDWFKTQEFPTARFVSSSVEQAGEGAYVAHGSLTIRDATKDLDLPFTLAIDGDTAKANGEVTLLRTNYGVGQGEFASDEWVGLDVKVSVEITATR
jgi:polyisoprenoid-binding protein YceI